MNSFSTSHACEVGAAVLTWLQDSRVHGVRTASAVGVHTELLRNAHLGSKQIHAILAYARTFTGH